MLKPVTILALDEPAMTLAAAVQQRAAAACGFDDLVQAGAVFDASLEDAVLASHARRQAPNNPLLTRDDVSKSELVLLVVSASGPAAKTVLDVAAHVRRLYDTRRIAAFFTVEILALLPDLDGAPNHGSAYSLLKIASAAQPAPFDAFWLMDAMNASRVRFGGLEQAIDTYAQAVVGAVMLEPERSGAPAARRPRGMGATFSSFGHAELVFPRELAAQRVETRFAAELVRDKLLAEDSSSPLAAKKFVLAEGFTGPLSRIGLEAGRTLFQRFQPKTHITESTRSADEVIAAVRHEREAHVQTAQTQSLEMLHAQATQAESELTTLLARHVDESLDRHGYPEAIRFLETLVDPLPDLRSDSDPTPRNLITEINTATAALDARLRFAPNAAASSAARKRVREIDELLADQKPMADVLEAQSAPEQLAELESERASLATQLPEILFAEEGANNQARIASRDAEAARLAAETEGAEGRLRELFARKPHAEQALREALQARISFLWRRILLAAFGVTALYAAAHAADKLRDHLVDINRAAMTALGLFFIVSLVQYLRTIAPVIRDAREMLAAILKQIEQTDEAKNAAHQEELQFACDFAHRRATQRVLQRTRERARQMLDALRSRRRELAELAESLVPPSIGGVQLSIAIVTDADVDLWYERNAEDRRPFLREFFEMCVSRSQSRQLALDELRARLAAFAARALDRFRKMTIAEAVQFVPEAAMAQRFKRLTEYSAPMVDLRDDDPEAQMTMQRDATLWADTTDAAFTAQLARRFPDVGPRSTADPLRIQVLTRILHFPAYVLGQLAYYRAQYDPQQHPESAALPDLFPVDRAAYEQVLLGRATGVICLRDDQQLAFNEHLLGDSHRAAAQRITAYDAAPLRRELDAALAPRLTIAKDVTRDLEQLAGDLPDAMDRQVLLALLARYSELR